MRAGAERAQLTTLQVVRELKLLGFSDIRKVVSWRNELVTRTEKGEDGEPVKVLMPRVTIVDADKIGRAGSDGQRHRPQSRLALDPGSFGAHSLRSDLVTTAVKRGVNVLKICDHGRKPCRVACNTAN